jgi:hypothetical protein
MVLVLALTCAPVLGAGIFDSIRAGDVEKVKALLKADPKLANTRSEDSSTPLQLAALEGHLAIAELLLDNRADVNARGPREETALHLAIYGGHQSVTELLLDQHADVRAQNSAGETPLHLAARKGHREIAELLLEHNADLKLADNQGFTALHTAAAAGQGEIVKLLLARNADPVARDKSGKTPIVVAEEKGHAHIREIFETRMSVVRNAPIELAAGARVGELSNAQRLAFDGNKTFSAETLRLGLKATPDFFEISHPMAPLSAYLEAIQIKLLLGYQHNGFPEPKLALTHDEKTDEILVKVEEGPRYVCGEVKVNALHKMPVAPLMKRLTVTNLAAQIVQPAFLFMDRLPPDRAQGSAGQPDCFWLPGEPAHFDEIALRRMTVNVSDTLREHGFFFPKLKLKVVPDNASRKADLQVQVEDEGPRGIIHQIEVVGNKKNSREAILNYLKLKPGIELTTELVPSIQNRLWHAARFLTNSVTLGSPDADGRLALRIEVFEHEPAPPLDQDFSPAQQVMLKSRAWLAGLGQRSDDLVVTASGLPIKTPDLELILSPRNGLALLEKSASLETNSGGRAIILASDHAAFYSLEQKRKLVASALGLQLKTYVTIDPKIPGPNPSETNEAPFTLSFGAGFNRLFDEKSRTGVSPVGAQQSPGYCLELTLPPVAFVDIPQRSNSACWFEGPVMTLSNEAFVLKIEAATGRPLEFIAKGETGKGDIQAHFQPGAFARVTKAIQENAREVPNAYDTNAPLSSLAAFLVPEVLSFEFVKSALKGKVSTETLSRLPALIKKLDLQEILSPLAQFWARQSGADEDQEAFFIPEILEPGASAGATGIAAAAEWLSRHSEELFPARSWLSGLAREAGLLLRGNSEYLGPTLETLYESKEPGPLACWIISELLERIHHPLARKFAARGLERLATADFRRDCRLLLQGDSVLSQTAVKLLEALRRLDAPEIETFAALQTAARAEFIRQSSTRLREAKEMPVFEAIAPALDSFWEKELKPQLTLALKKRAFDPAAALEQAIKLYQHGEDFTQAVGLFQQVAQAGHPGAQYFLGLAYEKGQGVTQDRAQALDWYRQAATNGSSQAAMNLGNSYGDGIEAPPDHLNAFVWYSVAAAHGQNLANAFRNSEQRKLTPDQLAQAQEQIRSIVAGHLSPILDSTAPRSP